MKLDKDLGILKEPDLACGLQCIDSKTHEKIRTFSGTAEHGWVGIPTVLCSSSVILGSLLNPNVPKFSQLEFLAPIP